jgi:hypothetical protein
MIDYIICSTNDMLSNDLYTSIIEKSTYYFHTPRVEVKNSDSKIILPLVLSIVTFVLSIAYPTNRGALAGEMIPDLTGKWIGSVIRHVPNDKSLSSESRIEILIDAQTDRQFSGKIFNNGSNGLPLEEMSGFIGDENKYVCLIGQHTGTHSGKILTDKVMHIYFSNDGEKRGVTIYRFIKVKNARPP